MISIILCYILAIHLYLLHCRSVRMISLEAFQILRVNSLFCEITSSKQGLQNNAGCNSIFNFSKLDRRVNTPQRTSSKRGNKRPFQDFDNDDRSRLLDLDEEISKSCKKLKPRLSFDDECFGSRQAFVRRATFDLHMASLRQSKNSCGIY